MNRNARIFLHPPGIEKDESDREADVDEWQSARSSVASDFSQTIVDPPPTVRPNGIYLSRFFVDLMYNDLLSLFFFFTKCR